MDSGSNLQARAFFCSKCWKRKKKKNAKHLKGDDYTSDPSLLIFFFLKNLTFIAIGILHFKQVYLVVPKHEQRMSPSYKMGPTLLCVATQDAT